MSTDVDTSAPVKRYVHEADSQVFVQATRLIEELDVAPAIVDALHVACATALGCSDFATADRQQALAAQRCGLSIHDFCT